MAHHVLRPVERDCICPTRPADAHTPNCEEAFRARFFGAWGRERDRFYDRPPTAIRRAPPRPLHPRPA
ncbi:MAG: hypothetical protein ACR2KV_13735 [Solirubrobacteraceae bacterium]